MSKRWFPKQGDLVIVPQPLFHVSTDKSGCDYGIVIAEEHGSDFPGVWWNVLHSGVIERFHINMISPLWDKEGQWLQSPI